MKSHFLRPWTALLCASALLSAHADFLINEIDADQPSADTREFVELYNSSDETAYDLTGLFVVMINGVDGKIYGKYQLDASGLENPLPPTGFMLLGNIGAKPSGFPNSRFITIPSNGLQNETEAVAIMRRNNTTDFASIVTNTTTLQNVLDLGCTVVDGAVYSVRDNSTEHQQLLQDAPTTLASLLLLPGQSGQTENPGTTTTNVEQSLAREFDGLGFPREMTAYVPKAPTPGASNQKIGSITITFPGLASLDVPENIGTPVTARISVSPAVTADTTITLASTDISEATVPASVVLPANATTVDFPVTVVNDAWPDGTVPVAITGSSLIYESGAAGFNVVDDDTIPQALVLNEYYSIGRDDANGDGTVAGNANDEFVELVNTGATALDLSGYGIRDSVTLRHVFPAGTILPAGAAIVVFGGGAGIVGSDPAVYGTAEVQKASSGTLGLNDAGDVVSIRNPAGEEIAGDVYSYAGITAPFKGRTRSPDLTGAFVLHPDTNFSPGTKVDGTPFVTLTQPLTLSISPSTVTEKAGAGAVTLTIGRPGSTAEALVVRNIKSGDSSEAVATVATATIPAGLSSVQIPVDVVDDTSVDGPQTVHFSATASGFLNGTTSTPLTVNDDGLDQPLNQLFLNEIDADVPSSPEAEEFIEVYDGGLGNRSLDGFLLVLYNGNASGNASYRTIDLAGHATNAQGYFAVTAAFVPQGATAAIGNDFLQNGVDAVALFKGVAADFPNGSTPAVGIPGMQDVVVYGSGSDADLTSGFGLLDTDVHAEGASNTAHRSISRVPDGTGAWVAKTETPGASNGTVTSGYDAWAAGYPGLGGKTDDDDGDGWPNLVEYAAGTSPVSQSAAPVVTLSTNPSGKPRLSFTLGTTDAALTVAAQSSTTLATSSWSASDVTISAVGNDVTADYTGSARDAFLRLVFTLAP